MESGDGADPLAGHAQHEQAGRARGRTVGLRQVAAQGELPVRAGRSQVHAPGAAEAEAGPQEGADRVRSLVLVRRGRHGQPGVAGEQRDQAVDVGGEVGIGEPAGQRAPGLLVRPGPGRSGAAPARRPRPLQRPLDRGRGGLQQGGRLGSGKAEDIAEHQYGGLPRGQPLYSGDERQLDRLPGLIPGRGPWRGVRGVVQEIVRVRLQPGDLVAAGRLGRLEGWHRLGRYAPPGCPPRVQALVGRDAVQPGPHRGPALESRQAPPGRQQGLLEHVLGVGERAEQPVAVHLQLTPERADQFAEGEFVTGAGALQQGVLHRLSIAATAGIPGGRAESAAQRSDRAGAGVVTGGTTAEDGPL